MEIEWELVTIDIVPPDWKDDVRGLSGHVEIEVEEFGNVLFSVVDRMFRCFLGIESLSSWMHAMSEDVSFMRRARLSILLEGGWGWMPFMFRKSIQNESGEFWSGGGGKHGVGADL